MASKPNKSLPADAETTEDVPTKTGPIPKSTETLESGATVETF